MQIYLVGGAVRDALLGLPVQDRDWVVVGATPDEMLAQGFQPVGKDFPVFLHPQTHEEFALARTERKTHAGYHGFAFHAAPDVTLEEDLARRDITINSIAARGHLDWSKPSSDSQSFKLEPEALVDPFQGLADLRNKVLRHTSPAFVEDPVRILRVARFAARFGDFEVAAETMSLMQQMVRDGEASALVPERVWQEIARGLVAPHPLRMVEVLRQCGAMACVVGVDAGLPALGLARAAAQGAPLSVRYACWVQAAGPLARAPREAADLANLLLRDAAAWEQASRATGRTGLTEAETRLGLFEACDAFRRPARCRELMQAVECVTGADLRSLRAALEIALPVALPPVLPAGTAPGPQVGALLRSLRLQALRGQA